MATNTVASTVRMVGPRDRSKVNAVQFLIALPAGGEELARALEESFRRGLVSVYVQTLLPAQLFVPSDPDQLARFSSAARTAHAEGLLEIAVLGGDDVFCIEATAVNRAAAELHKEGVRVARVFAFDAKNQHVMQDYLVGDLDLDWFCRETIHSREGWQPVIAERLLSAAETIARKLCREAASAT